MKHEDVTEEIIGAFFEVYNTLGYGFLEKDYENALCAEFERRGLSFVQQYPIEVGLILNFGPKAKVVRKVFDNDLKRPESIA